jgi:carboxymethylenebutenolidase
MQPQLSLPHDAAANDCGVVVLHGVAGLEPGLSTLTNRLAELGYAVILPDLFHRYENIAAIAKADRVPGLAWEDVRADVDNARKTLRTHRVRRTAILGYCFGGTVALMAAATMPFETAVMYYPHSLFAPFGSGTFVPATLIPQLRASVLGHFGANDKNPSPADMLRLDEELTAANVYHRLHVYDGAGHGFAVQGESRPSFREAQAISANERTVEWLDRELVAKALR